jgi:LEA14-like dessication related protein
LIVVATILCAGCLKSPDVELASVRLAGLGLRGATLLADLTIENPNRFAIESDSLTFVLESSDGREPATWARVTSGTHAHRYRVDKNGRTSIRVPIEFGYSGLRAPIRSLLENGTFNYRISGQVFVRKPLHWTVPYSRTGNVAL